MSSDIKAEFKTRPPIIGVDFDGTVVEHAYPMIGKPLPHAIRVLQRLSQRGCLLVLWTCRENAGRLNFLTQAEKFLANNGVTIRSVNENHPEDEFRAPGSLRRKIYADVYIDDRNFPPLPAEAIWPSFELYAELRGWLPELEFPEERNAEQETLLQLRINLKAHMAYAVSLI